MTDYALDIATPVHNVKDADVTSFHPKDIDDDVVIDRYTPQARA